MSEDWERSESGVTSAQPIWRPGPRSTMIFPLVLLAAVVPGLCGLPNWDLTPPSPWWGLRALMVLDGRWFDQAVPEPPNEPPWPAAEAEAFRSVALQPPLYAWLEAPILALSQSRAPASAIIPSYLAGAAAILLTYWHGRVWGKPALGLIAAFLAALNPALLSSMQHATPSVLGLAFLLLTLLSHAHYLQDIPGQRMRWTLMGGVGIGLGFLSLGLFALMAAPVIWVHHFYLRAESPPEERTSQWWRVWRSLPGFFNGVVMLLIGLAIASPWLLGMGGRYGWEIVNALSSPPDAESLRGSSDSRLNRLVMLAPAILPLGLYAVYQAIKHALQSEDEEEIKPDSFWTIWLVAAVLLDNSWPSGPRAAFDMMFLIPLTLLAAQAIVDLANRETSAKSLIVLAPATALTIAWWISSSLREALDSLIHGQIDAKTALGLHLAFDLAIILVLAVRYLDDWARRRDDRQRWILRGFLLAVFAVNTAGGIRELRFQNQETSDLVDLRQAILRRHHQVPFQSLVVVSDVGDAPNSPGTGGRLRFILRSAFPELRQRNLSVEQLDRLPEEDRLIIVNRQDDIPFALRARLKLETIYPRQDGILKAWATVREENKRQR